MGALYLSEFQNYQIMTNLLQSLLFQESFYSLLFFHFLQLLFGILIEFLTQFAVGLDRKCHFDH